MHPLLLDLARRVAAGTVDYSGVFPVPAELVGAIGATVRLDDRAAFEVARLVLAAMGTMHAVSVRLHGEYGDSGDCAY